MDRLPGAVLFACNFNRVRSPIAEALLKRIVGDRVYVDSAGVKHDEEETPDPFVTAVMAEIGIDMSRHSPKVFAELEDDSFDLIISLTPEAQHQAVELARGRATEIEYWATPDPTQVTGGRDAVLEAYRDLRDTLLDKIAERFAAAASTSTP